MKNSIFSRSFVFFAAVLMLVAPALPAYGQATASSLLLTPTSLSSAVTTTSGTTIRVASATGITANNTLLYVDDGTGGNGEAMFVNSVNGTAIGVTRGYQGSSTNPHLTGAVVLSGPPQNFYSVDPSGSCTAASTVTPYVNILDGGSQWICSSITASFVPGFFNDKRSPGVTTAVASAAGAVNPSGPLLHITGGLAITAFGSSTTAGLGAGGGGSTQATGAPFCVIPDGAFTTTATNNIAKASTAVVNVLLCFTYDQTNKKYVPTY